jgi:DNA (cytosine-5)-methyltransferase 1
MENVPDVIGSKNLPHFRDWRDKLESMGYKCYWQVLNSKDYGIPQNRERCFMISILGDYFYAFPQEIKLPRKLIDMLETQVDEKYYLSQKAIKGKLETKFRVTSFEGCLPQEDGCCRTLCARDYKDPKCVVEIEEPIACELRCDEGIRTFKDNIMGTLRTIDGCGDKHIIEPTLKEQLCDRLVESGLLKVGTVINHSYTNGLNGKNPNSRQTLEDYIESENGICNTLTTRPDVLGVAVEDLTTKNKRLASMVDKIDPTKCQAIDMFNQSVHEEMHTIKTNVDRANMTAITQNLRIRKLTPRECFRLMGVRDENFERIAKSQSNASLYHLAGDSIVVAVLVAVLSHFVDGFDFNQYIYDFYKQIKEKEDGNPTKTTQ